MSIELFFPRVVIEERDPLNIDDSTRGYVLGQPWLNVVSGDYFICRNIAQNSAIWERCLKPSDLYHCCAKMGDIERVLSGILDQLCTDGYRAKFIVDNMNGPNPLTVHFMDKTIGSPSSWMWYFGDGETSTQQNPSHVYNSPGFYKPVLVATFSDGSQDMFTHPDPIMVFVGFNANFTANTTSGDAPLTVSFTNQSTGDNITDYLWDFGDGATSTSENPSHTYSSNGFYDVSLTITNSASDTDTTTKTDYIAVGMTIDAQFNMSVSGGEAPLSVNFTDQSTGMVSAYNWNFGDGSSSTAQNPSHTFNNVGSYDVVLTVTGPAGTDTRTKTVIVSSQIEAPEAQFSADQTTGISTLTVQFTDTSTGSISTYDWDFGDGSTSTLRNPSHTYSSPGAYTVSLTVTGPGGSDTETKSSFITVSEDTGDAQIIDPNLKIFDVLVNDWSSNNWSLPPGWSIRKVNSDTGLEATHNTGLSPNGFIITNMVDNVFVPESSTRTIIENSTNIVTFTQCVVADSFKCSLLFPESVSGGNSITIYRLSITDWLNSIWNIPNGTTLVKTSSTIIDFTHNVGTNPCYWYTDAYDANAIRNLYFTDSNTCRLVLPSSISNSFTIDIYFKDSVI